MPTNVPLPIVAVVGLVGGTLCAWGALATWRSERRFLRTAVRTQGVIEDFVVRTGIRSIAYPVVRFTTGDGASVSAVSNSTRSFLRVGQKVRVDYDPADPHTIEMASWWSHWMGPGVLLLFAAVLLWIGVMAVQKMLSS